MSKQQTTKLPTQQEKLTAILRAQPELQDKLLEALETGRFFITVTFQKKSKPTDKHDYHHFYMRGQFMKNDVVSVLKHIANDFKAKEMPGAEIEGNEWH